MNNLANTSLLLLAAVLSVSSDVRADEDNTPWTVIDKVSEEFGPAFSAESARAKAASGSQIVDYLGGQSGNSVTRSAYYGGRTLQERDLKAEQTDSDE